MTQDAWQRYLDPDEKILWQGHPRRDFVLPSAKMSTVIFGLIFIGFSIFWMIVAARDGEVIWVFGLFFFGLGLHLLYRNLLKPTVSRMRTHYTLTNKRMFIATNMLFERRSLKSFAIDKHTRVDVRLDPYPSLILDADRYWDHQQNMERQENIGFELLEDVERVSQLIRDIQTGKLAGDSA